jgi:hypothetical protein
MKASDLTQNPVSDSEPIYEGDTLPVFLLKWFTCSALFTLVSLYLMPIRFDLSEQLSDPLFYAEALFWFMSSLLLAVYVYESSIPGALKRIRRFWAFAPLMMTVVLVVLRGPIHGIQGIREETLAEMDLYRGRCGPIITGTGLLAAGIFYFWARKSAASVQPRFAAFAVALSAGSLASFIMEFICPHENVMHLIIWHFLPLVLLGTLAALAGRKLLNS